MTKILIAYFSACGITQKTAKNLAKILKSDIYEIKPAISYSSSNLNWMDKTSRSSIEMRNLDIRPELADKDAAVENYDIIFLGFPIWWYIAPTIINTFLESYDFSNKKIVLFATSGGSGFGKTVEFLRPSVSDSTKIIEGKILNYNPDIEELKEWVKTVIVRLNK